MKLFSLLFIALVLLQAFKEASGAAKSLTQVDETGTTGAATFFTKIHHRKINCHYAYARRCRLASRKKMCSRACKSCCARCHCVPPGTYGNKNTCPCYTRLRTHGNRPKCP